jgi:hypothetical protein
MVKETKHLDITHTPELLRLAEEVHASREPCVLRRASEDLAMVVPVRKKRKTKRTISQADYDAFLSSAGGWKDFDLETFLRNNARSRRISTRPPVGL